MKFLILFILLTACHKKQDFINDLAVPPALIKYHQEKTQSGGISEIKP